MEREERENAPSQHKREYATQPRDDGEGRKATLPTQERELPTQPIAARVREGRNERAQSPTGSMGEREGDRERRERERERGAREREMREGRSER